MNTLIINGKIYTEISREQPYKECSPETERVVVESKNGARKIAQFYKGAFELWENSGSSKPSWVKTPNRRAINWKG